MKFFIGAIVVIGCTLTGYYLHGGNIMVLYQPTEYIIIGGAAVGSFIIANTGHSIKGCLKGIKTCLKGGLPYTKAQYLELLKFQYEIFKFMKTKGMLEIESHIENPDKSDLFSKYPSILSNHHALDFICDYIRVMTMGVDDKYQLEDMMDKELEVHHHEKHVISHAVITIGDALPAIGIVAAVLGVIITMGSIAEPPEILGGLVGAALVGTFLGIFLCYGLVGPMGQYLDKYFSEEHQYFDCIKTGLLCHLQGNAPAVSAEFARKVIPDVVKPSFKELEEAMQEVK